MTRTPDEIKAEIARLQEELEAAGLPKPVKIDWQFKPSLGDWYYVQCGDGKIHRVYCTGSIADCNAYEMGLVRRTPEEPEADAAYLRARAKLMRASTKDGWEPDLKCDYDNNFYMYLRSRNEIIIDNLCYIEFGVIYFPTAKACLAAYQSLTDDEFLAYTGLPKSMLEGVEA